MSSQPFSLQNPFDLASLPYFKSTSPTLPLQDVLFNMFSNRQSIFSGSPQASGSPDATWATPFSQQLNGGGLEWSYDPNWMTGVPQQKQAPDYLTLAAALTGGGKGSHRGDVHSMPVDVQEWNPNDPLGNLHAPAKPPDQPGGHWVWQANGGGTGIPGQWVFVNDSERHTQPTL